MSDVADRLRELADELDGDDGETVIYESPGWKAIQHGHALPGRVELRALKHDDDRGGVHLKVDDLQTVVERADR